MPVLSASQIAGYAANAGFSGSALNTAVAIALAESSGNPSVVGDTSITPGGSVGLMQINLAAHPEYSAADLLDPQTNMDAAYQIYQDAGGSFTPWTTYNSGAYASSLPSMALTVYNDDSGDEDSDLFGSIDPNLLLIGGVAAVALALYLMEA
jgi:Lysozyme like domain